MDSPTSLNVTTYFSNCRTTQQEEETQKKEEKKKKDKWIVFSLNKIGDLRNNIYIFTVESILISCNKHRLSIS